jgi:hypothetical protein
MRALSLPPELEAVARRCVWFRAPDEALGDPVHFIAHVLTFGMHEDLRTLRQHASDDDLREALAQAPPGVFDARSWSYWHLLLNGRSPAPPLPTRRLPR